MPLERCPECQALGSHLAGCSKASTPSGDELDPAPASAPMNLLCHVASVASLVLSILCGISLFPGPSNGFYGGTGLFLAFVIAGQGLVLIFAVGIPAGCVYLSGRRPASRFGMLLFCAAMIAVVIEFFRVNAIPVTGGS